MRFTCEEQLRESLLRRVVNIVRTVIQKVTCEDQRKQLLFFSTRVVWRALFREVRDVRLSKKLQRNNKIRVSLKIGSARSRRIAFECREQHDCKTRAPRLPVFSTIPRYRIFDSDMKCTRGQPRSRAGDTYRSRDGQKPTDPSETIVRRIQHITTARFRADRTPKEQNCV